MLLLLLPFRNNFFIFYIVLWDNIQNLGHDVTMSHFIYIFNPGKIKIFMRFNTLLYTTSQIADTSKSVTSTFLRTRTYEYYFD